MQARCELATRIWCAGDSDAERRRLLEQSAEDGVDPTVFEAARSALMRHLAGPCNRLPPSEMQQALAELGLLEENNALLSDNEKHALDQDGYINLGPLLDEDTLARMRERYDEAIASEGDQAGHEVSQMHGIGRLSGTVLKPMNRDGLLDPLFMHPRLLAVARYVLGTHFRYSSSNYHCPLPGHGHQFLHADWGWGITGAPQVVNAIWMLDDFTDDNGPTRVVPGSHRSGQHPHGAMVDGKLLDLNAPVPGERYVTGRAGSCVVYNAHLWHGGTQNRTGGLRRSQHMFFTRAERRTQSDAPALLDPDVYARLSRTQRAVLDLP